MVENEEQQQSKEESAKLKLYINGIKTSIMNIKRLYQIDFSIIGELLKFQKESEVEQNELFSMNLEGDAKLKSEIYPSDTFLKQIANPITNYIEKKEYNYKELEQILENINDFLFRINFQFDRYLQKTDEKIIFNKENNENNKSTENLKEIKYNSIQHSNIIFSFTSFKTIVEGISSNMILLSLLFQIQQMNIELENKINTHDKKIEEHEKAVKEQERNMMTIMGIFISIFSLIQVNLSFFSHFEGKNLQSWIVLILVINITLVQTIKVIFNLIHQKYNNQENIISLINKKICDKILLCTAKTENKNENSKNMNSNNSQNSNSNID